MSNVNEVKKVEVKKMSKEVLDAKIETILKAKEMIKTLQQQVINLQTELETQYTKPVNESEVVLGNKYKIVKTARDMGKSSVDYSKAKTLLTPAQLEMVEEKVINIDKLKAMIKVKLIDELVFPVIKTVSWTSATSFSNIQNVETIEVKVPKKKASVETPVEVPVEKKKFLGIF